MKEYILNNLSHLIILLIVLCLIIIAIFKKSWSEKIFHGFTMLLMFLTYWTIFALTAIFVKISGKDLMLPFKKRTEGYWIDYKEKEHTIENAKKQG